MRVITSRHMGTGRLMQCFMITCAAANQDPTQAQKRRHVIPADGCSGIMSVRFG